MMLRFCPDRPLPSYSYVPGSFPHPISDPAGHSYKSYTISEQTRQADPGNLRDLASDWRLSSEYLFGIDLFNHGFYWEAHETWEQLWIVFGRSGRNADFMKGLIKLAAAGVKAREGRASGVQRHALRARDLFLLVAESLRAEGNSILLGGLDLQSLGVEAEAIAANAIRLLEDSDNLLTIVLPLLLSPLDQKSEKQIRG